MDYENSGTYDPINDELIDISEVENITSLKAKTIYAKERKGEFPRRVKLGRRTAWVKREIHAWVRARMDARPANPTYLPIIPINARRKGGKGRPGALA